MKEHEHTVSHEPAAGPVPGELAKDPGSKHPAHQGGHAHMAADFRTRFWISLVLTLPILALSPMLQSLVGLRETIRFPGDIYVLIASAAWAIYSWMLTRTDEDPPELRSDWAAFLMAQVVMGLGWSGLFAAGEWAMTDAHIVWGWPLAAALAYIAICPAILAYRYWGLGVQRAGPTVAAFFSNLTPLFAALLSAAALGESPHPYHALAFALIVGGIALSSRR